MRKQFQHLLAEWLDINNLSRSDFIAKLQLYDFENFKGLDSITLSRWLNGKTTPPTYKQISIAQCLHIDIVELIKHIDKKDIKSSNKKSKIVSEFIRMVDLLNPRMSYRKADKNTRVKIEYFTYQQHIDMLGDFYHNLLPLKSFTNGLYKLGNDILYPTLRILNEADDIIGHWVGVEPFEEVVNLPSFPNLTKEEIDVGYLLMVGFHQNSKDYFDLLSYTMCAYLLSPRVKKTRTVYIFINGHSLYEVSRLAFDAEDVKFYPSSDKDIRLGIHLIKVDILKVIANPILFPLIQKHLKCLENCTIDCKKCNLKSYSDSYK